MKKILMILAAALFTLSAGQVVAQSAKDTKTAVFTATMHCNNCKSKVEKAIPFEKGVKDVRIDMEKQRVEVDYDTKKTSPEELLKAFEKIKIPAKIDDSPTKN